eukprot:tig00000802_g4256.t1
MKRGSVGQSSQLARPSGGSSGVVTRSSSAGRQRTVRRAPTSTAVARPNTGGGNFLRFYTEDSPGLKIGPNVVLCLSLLFIGFVILLHIWGKFHR